MAVFLFFFCLFAPRFSFYFAENFFFISHMISDCQPNAPDGRGGAWQAEEGGGGSMKAKRPRNARNQINESESSEKNCM